MRPGICRGMATISFVVLAVVSCRTEVPSEKEQRADAPALAAQAGRYSVQDFAQLRWLEGSWRGRLPDGGYFYERYGLVDDSTIVMHGFADSTLARATDSARITLRDGTIADEGGSSRWVATRLDSNVVDFTSAKEASNGFAWARESPDRWTATLRSTDAQRRPQTTVYRMERIGR